MNDTYGDDDSALYRRLAPVAVPDRAEQIATLPTLLRYDAGDAFRVLEAGRRTPAIGGVLDNEGRASV